MARKDDPAPDPKKAEGPTAAKPGDTGHVGRGPGDHLVAPTFPTHPPGYGSVEWLHEQELTVQQTIKYFQESILRVARDPSTEPNYRPTVYLLQKYEIQYKQISMSNERNYYYYLELANAVQSLGLKNLDEIRAYAEYRDKTFAALEAWRLSYRILNDIHVCLHGGDTMNVANQPPVRK